MTAKVQDHLFEYEVYIKSYLGGRELKISNIVSEINMYEDMFGPFMRIELVVADAIGLMDKLPIIGDEEIRFEYNITGRRKFYQIFKLFKVTDRTLIKARTQAMILHGITYEGHKNRLQSVYKPFIEMEPDKIVRDVFENYIWSGIGKMLRVPVPCKNKVTRVSSGQSPLQLINFLSAESQANDSPDYKKPSNYVFFEAADDFYYVFLPYLFNSLPNYEFFLNVPQEKKKFEKGKNTWPSESIISMNFVNNLDHMDELRRGSYLNEINIIDPILKRFKMHPIQDKERFQFKYLRDFKEKLPHLPDSGQEFITENGDVGKGEKPYAAHRRMLMTQIDDIDYLGEGKVYPEIGYLEGRLSAGDALNAPRARHKNLNLSLHEMNNLSSQVVEVTIPGDPELFVGSLIKIKIPQPTNFEDDANKFLRLYGQEATFLVTAIRHIYKGNNDGYFMVLSCSTESFGEKPAPQRVV